MSTTTPHEGTPVDDAGRYVLGSRIATGGMGEVWRAHDEVLNRPVAVKVLKSEYADNALFRARFETEARHAASLHHPGIAAVFDFGQSAPTDGSGNPRPYLVMELVEGQPLSDLLRPGTPLDPAVAQDLLAQAAVALGAAHAAGIVHRDVKPANLIITPDRRVKVTDFGIARAAEGMSLTETGQVLGTPAYISPEQAEGGTATAASDVYSLGVVAFECLTGRKPFLADTPVATAIAHLRNPVPDLPDSVPADLAGVVRRSLAKSPGDRFADGAAFARSLRDPAAAMGGGPATELMPGAVVDAPATQVMPVAPSGGGTATEPRTETVAHPPPVRRRTAPTSVVLGLLAVVAAVALAIWLGSRDPEPTSSQDPGESPSQTESQTQDPTEEATQDPTQDPTETGGPSETTPEPTTVEVDPGDYVGRRYKDVAKDLDRLGLVPELVELENPGDQEKDLVVEVSPSGTLDEGDTVTISYYGKPPKGNGEDDSE